jgi:hypothetical protein
MALERFIAEHLRIAETLVGVPCERMTALEINLACMPYDVAEATLIADRANDNGTYTVLHALLQAIGDKIGVDVDDEINAAEEVDCFDDDEIMDAANELLEVLLAV